MDVLSHVLGIPKIGGGGGVTLTQQLIETTPLEFWDPSIAASLWRDTTATTPAGDGNAVQRIDGQLGNFSLTQATEANAPVLDVDGLNGGPCLDFTAANTQWLAADAIAAELDGEDTPFTLTIAQQLKGNAGYCTWSLGSSAGATPNMALVERGTPDFDYSVQRACTNSIGQAAGTIDENPRIVTVIFTGTTVTVRVSGVVIINNLPLDAATCGFNRFTIGALRRATVALPLAAKVGRAVLWTRAIDADDLAIGEAWAAE